MKTVHTAGGILIILGITMVASCKQGVSSRSYDFMLKTMLSHSVPLVTVAEVKLCADCIFLDAREQKEYNISHINNALWVGFQTFQAEKLTHIKKDQKIIVYCSIGYRSEKIAEKLLRAGYGDVSNFYGGIFEWVNDGNPVYKTNFTSTDEVHAYSRMWSRWLQKGKKIYN